MHGFQIFQTNDFIEICHHLFIALFISDIEALKRTRAVQFIYAKESTVVQNKYVAEPEEICFRTETFSDFHSNLLHEKFSSKYFMGPYKLIDSVKKG